MTFLRTTTLTSAFALMAGPALAAVTAQDVWDDWQELFANYGMTLTTGGESTSGGSLNVTGVTLGFEMPEGSSTFSIGDLTFSDEGGGTVRVTMSEQMPITVNVTGDEGEEASISMTISQPGASMIVSGDPDAIRYDYDYPIVTVGDFDMSGADMPDDFPAIIDMTMNNLTGFIAMEDVDLRKYSSITSIASLVADISVDVPEDEGGGAFAMAFNLSDLQQTTNGTLGRIDMGMSVAQMVQGGMEQVGTATHGPASYTIDVDGPDGAFSMATAAASGTLNLSMGEGGISYGGNSNDVTVAISGDMIPFPVINLSMAESGGVFTMPVVPGDDPQDFALVMRMVGLEVDDMIWGMFDPGGQLPRDPATLVVDLGGKAVLTEDFTAPEYAENPNAAPPGTLEEIKVNALQLTIAGAELTGTGAFEFDNSMGVPMPAGTADLALTGANTLMDTLVGMGLLPQEQAMGARMMLGMFARPGPGEDSLTSQIEVTKDGQVLANGQRIR